MSPRSDLPLVGCLSRYTLVLLLSRKTNQRKLLNQPGETMWETMHTQRKRFVFFYVLSPNVPAVENIVTVL